MSARWIVPVVLALCGVPVLAVWHVEDIYLGGIDPNPSLALTSTGEPCIAVPASQAVKYAFRIGTQWTIETVWTCSYGNPWFVSLAMGPGDAPQVSFGYSGLYHATRSGPGSWTSGSAASIDAVYTSSAVDAEGHPSIACMDQDDLDCFLVSDEGSGWVVQEVDAGYETGYGCSLALDGNGDPFMTFARRYPDRLVCAYREGGVWSVEVVDTLNISDVSTVFQPFGCSVAVDPSGQPRIAYNDGSVRYAWRDDGGWHIESVDETDSGSFLYGVSLALDGSGSPRIAWCTQDAHLMYGWRTGSGWESETVCTGLHFFFGGDPSLALDASGTPYIAFCRDLGRLTYAWDDGTGVAEPPLAPAGGLSCGNPYPDPACGTITVPFTLTTAAEVDFTLYDLAGREMGSPYSGWYCVGEHQMLLAVPGPGLYLVRVICGEVMESRSFVSLN